MSEPWFRPKSFGYGAGWPIHWKGWALLAAYTGVVLLASQLIPIMWPVGVVLWGVIVVAATVGLAAISKAKTRGGWRWRSGKGE